MRALNVLLSILVSLAIGLAVLEGGLRLIGMGPPHNLNQFDADTGWSKQPDGVQTKHTPEYDVTLRTNAFGLRDDPMPTRDKAPNSQRVVALGDSFTLGYAVDRPDLFVDMLERWWRAEERRTDVINGGTEGWSTDQQVAWFLAEGHRYQPDLVLVFAYENDLYWSSETQYMPDLDKPRFTADGQLEPRELEDHAGNRWTDDFALTRLLFKKPLDRERFFFQPAEGSRPIAKEWGALLLDPPAFMADAEARTAGALRALKARCDQLGARAVVVPIPSHSLVDAEYRSTVMGPKVLGLPDAVWSPDRPVDTFLRLAQEAGLDSIDLRAALKGAAAQGQKLYYDVDWHLDPTGNAVFATALKGELDARGYFPPEFAPTREVAVMPAAEPHGSAGAPFALKLFGVLWLVLSTLYILTYRDEPAWQPPLKVLGLLTSVFAVFFGARFLIKMVPPQYAAVTMVGLIGSVLLFVAYKLGHRVGTILELMKSFTLRGHWYLMPLVVVLLTVGSLLVVAASSPLIAPFIYTLF